jgi:hypothetical protein
VCVSLSSPEQLRPIPPSRSTNTPQHPTLAHNPPRNTHPPHPRTHTRYLVPLTRAHPSTQTSPQPTRVLSRNAQPDASTADLEHVDGYRGSGCAEVGAQGGGEERGC